MATKDRVERTVDKVRIGALPAPTSNAPSVDAGYGNRCSGCSENIREMDEEYVVDIPRVALLRFHGSCYTAWARSDLK
jgi:hypothetical protein